MKPLILLPALVLALCACGAAPPEGAAAPDGNARAVAAATPDTSADTYFSYVIDGERYDVAEDDVLTSVWPDGTFKVYAGADRARSIALTIPDIANCPCSVPAGSIVPSDMLAQGSVSLQNHPAPGHGLNNWYMGQSGTPPSAAITVTDIGAVQQRTRYVTGTFSTTVLKTESNGDGPENRDYVITDGRFRVRHTVSGGDAF